MRQLEAIRCYARFGCARLRKVAESCKKLHGESPFISNHKFT